MKLSEDIRHATKQHISLFLAFVAVYGVCNFAFMGTLSEDVSIEQVYSASAELNISAWLGGCVALALGALCAIWQAATMSGIIQGLQAQINTLKNRQSFDGYVAVDSLTDIHHQLQAAVDNYSNSDNKITDASKLKTSFQQSTDTVHEGLRIMDTVASNAHSSSSAAMEMVAASNEVAENIQSLTESTEETASNIEEMTYSIKEVAHNIEELSALAEETAAAINQMDVSIGQVENNAVETAKLSEDVNRDADHGVSAITHTIAGINKIKETSESSATAIKSLESKIEEIGAILNVIDEVAEQTNLLALNAAIIAAQAGEHGRGFAVVADEIKDLAERTGNSTKEIATLIKSVQDETKKAVNVIEQGTIHVEQGVSLSYEAEKALRKILESVGHSQNMVKAIAQATVEQNQSSKQVTAAITKIAQNVQQISMATNEQARGSEQLVQAAEKMRLISMHVERSSVEQSKAGQDINNSLAEINNSISSFEELTKRCQNVFDHYEHELDNFINNVSNAQRTDIGELQMVLSNIARLSLSKN